MDDFRFVKCPICGWEKNPRMPCFNCGDKAPATSTTSSDTALAAAEARIAELEGYNVGLATESRQQQERIATLQKALEPLSDLSGAWGDHDSDMDEKLVLVQCIDARRAAALLKEKE